MANRHLLGMSEIEQDAEMVVAAWPFIRLGQLYLNPYVLDAV